ARRALHIIDIAGDQSFHREVGAHDDILNRQAGLFKELFLNADPDGSVGQYHRGSCYHDVFCQGCRTENHEKKEWHRRSNRLDLSHMEFLSSVDHCLQSSTIYRSTRASRLMRSTKRPSTISSTFSWATFGSVWPRKSLTILMPETAGEGTSL